MFWHSIIEIYSEILSVLRKSPAVLLLFIGIAIFDCLALVTLFFAPSPPVSYVLAPIIRTFWGDQFLHYPENFLLLPKLFNHAHFLVTTVIGVFVSGVVIKRIEADITGENLSTLAAARPVFKRYFSLLVVWLLSYGVYALSMKYALEWLPKNLWIQLGSGFLLGLFVQSLLAFLFPALVIMKHGFFKALWKGLQFGMKNILLTIGLFFIPMFVVFLFSFVKLLTPYFVHVHPELVLWVLAGGIAISLAVDMVVTSSATLLFLKVRHGK